MYKVTVHAGKTLYEELAAQNMEIETPCGGKGVCGNCAVVLRGGERVLACQYRTVGEVEIEEIPQRRFSAVMAWGNWPVPKTDTPLAAADIGTTTVVLVLFWKGRSTARSFVNPQRAYGADVMSRIQAANEGRAESLCSLIRTRLLLELEDMYRELAGETHAGIKFTLIVSANTTMQHLLEGLSCARLGEAPFVPESLAHRSFDIGSVKVVQLPGISAFVGADIVCGLSVIDILHRKAPVLFLDLGTNGEMALGCGERLLVASAAAGPAFEGSPVAMQIYGAGVLHLLRDMLAQGIMDEYGTLNETYFESGYPVAAADYRADGAGEENAQCIVKQEDIREFQMAKAAVCAGIELLLAAYGIEAGQVEHVYLAGGFGSYLDPADALAVGLLPDAFAGRITAAGNTSLEGAAAYAADPEHCGRGLEEICRRAELISLPDCKGFEECYIDKMNFEREEVGLYGN